MKKIMAFSFILTVVLEAYFIYQQKYLAAGFWSFTVLFQGYLLYDELNKSQKSGTGGSDE